MNKAFFVTIALVSLIKLHAEEIDMLTGSPEWDYNSYYATGELCSTEPTYKIDDESMGVLVKNGNTYHKVYLLELLCEETSEGCVYALSDPFVGIREASGKVYAEYDSYMALVNEGRTGAKGELPFLVTEEGEILLYDFTVSIGERWPASDVCAPIFVRTVEKVTTTDGIQRKLITLDNGLQLLEGIGCLNSNGLLLHYLYTSGHWFHDYYGNSVTHNLCVYYRNGIPVYLKDKNTDMTPVYTYKSHYDLNYYDLQGRPVTGTPRPGVYISEGRKRVVR